MKTRFGAYANHRISTIPEGMDDAAADKGQTVDIRVKPVSNSDAPHAQTRTASLAMLKAIVFAVTPLLAGWCAGAPDRMVPSLLRWALSETAYTQGTNATKFQTFRTVVRREFGDEVKSLGKAMSKKKKRQQRRRQKRRK